MAKNRQILNDSFIMATLDDLVPQDHMVRKLDEFIDWDFIYDICDPLYSDIGAERVDPVVLFKMMFINIIFGYHSMRRTCEEIKVNIAYRWFLGIGFDQKVPDHSTFSQNYRRKFRDNNVAISIFEHFIGTLVNNGIADPSVLYIDGTHLKANANKHKYESREVEIAAKRYQKELDEEIARDREAHGLKQLKSKKKENSEKKEIKASTTDPDCGYFHKGEKEKCFAYNVNAACDRRGYVMAMSLDAGNVHDSVAFDPLKDDIDHIHGEDVETLVMDTGYSTAPICHRVHKDGQEAIVPAKRTAAKRKGAYKKNQYQYNKEEDCYVCPAGCIIEYKTTTREGKRQYRSDGKQCESCPNLKRCTLSENHVKVIERHVWQEDLDQSTALQKSDEGREIYKARKETVERLFGDGKRRHGLDYTLYMGFERVYDSVALTFTAMNMKKLCTYWGKLRDECAQNMSFEHQNDEVKKAIGLI